MRQYITLDLGTTKSKISLVRDGRVIDSLKISSSGESSDFTSALRAKIAEILEKNKLSEKDIISILATGTMASAEMGIYPLEHAVCPIGKDGIKKSAAAVSLPEISGIPFFITRGVKVLEPDERAKDMMRGEESEIYGLRGDDSGEALYLLMGSHTKLVRVSGRGQITDIATMLTGELASALVSSTILRHSVSFEESELDGEYLSLGYKYATENSIGEALFRVRVLRSNHRVGASEAYSFFIGALLSGEVGYVIRSGAPRVIISGNKHLKDAVAMLLSEHTDTDVMFISDEESESAVSLGLVRIFEEENS